jgi:hypothetical protein
MADKKLCDERHETCGKRMDSHSRDIRDRVPWKTFAWTIGVIMLLVFGSYGYTKTVSDDVKKVVTVDDMNRYQDAIIEAIKGAK